MKFSDNPEKTTNPGIKQVWRIKDSQGATIADVLALADAEMPEPGHRCCFWHPSADYRHFYQVIEGEPQMLLQQYLADGKPCKSQPPLNEIRAQSIADMETFDPTYKRLLNPHVYKVSITEELRSLKLKLIEKHLGTGDT
jgi:nicotinate phosphoribosyltransferase